jgi:hypothetical protein
MQQKDKVGTRLDFQIAFMKDEKQSAGTPKNGCEVRKLIVRNIYFLQFSY